MKYKQPCLGFELGLLIPFLTMITVMLSVLPMLSSYMVLLQTNEKLHCYGNITHYKPFAYLSNTHMYMKLFTISQPTGLKEKFLCYGNIIFLFVASLLSLIFSPNFVNLNLYKISKLLLYEFEFSYFHFIIS